MHFLTALPQDWTQPQLPQLRDLFVQAYGRQTEAKELADAVGIVPGTFPMCDNMRSTWTELIRLLGKQGKLRALVEKAMTDPTIGGLQHRFAHMLQESPNVPAQLPKPTSHWWKGDDEYSGVLRGRHERLLAQRSRFIPVEIARRISEYSRSVAKLTLRFGKEEAYGTGFLIQPNLLLTNHHNVTHETYGNVQHITAEFDYEQGFDGIGLICKGSVESIIANADHDWAVIQLEHPVDRTPLVLGTAFDVCIDDSVIIIQHPIGSFKQFAVDMLSIRYVDNLVIQYLADTQSGSSGSPVFNIKMEIIALHNMEVYSFTNIAGKQILEWRNQGIRINQIMKDLTAENIPYISH